MRKHWLLLIPFVLLLAVAGGCGDDGGTESGENGENGPSGMTPTAAVVSPVETVPVFNQETPTSFEEQRDALKAHLDSIGVNIGAVPADVRRQLLDSCGLLEAFADSEAVEEICSSIDNAIEQDAPELLDAIVDSLSELEAE